MFRIKICGVTTVPDALGAAEAGADAIGLNFYPPSPRRVDMRTAEEMAEAVPAGVAKVGVFVNETAEKLIRTHDRLGLDLIQLHGDEPPELLESLGDRAVVWAFRCGDGWLDELRHWLKTWRELDRWPEAVLMDAFQPGSYGGAGKVFDWELVDKARRELGDIKIALAGGLTPANVGDAIAAARPYAVDTASGVEASPGKKDLRLVREFVAAARAAFGRSDSADATD
jgi:phosphoribosylanthranilate isomerase